MRPYARVSGTLAPVALVVATVGLLVGWLTPTAAQQPETARRSILSDLTAGAIDAGLRGNDPPRRARTERQAVVRQTDREYLRGSLIVRFRAGTSLGSQRAMLAQVDGTATPTPSYADFEVVTLAASDDPEIAARRLAAQPDVEFAQARYRVRPMFVPNDPLYRLQWNYPALDMERAWDINRGATSNITVAVLDTGVAFRSALLRFNGLAWQREDGAIMPALGPVTIPFAAAPDLGTDRFVSPRDFIWDDDTPFDLDGHGTHVSGTVGQLTNNGVGGAGMAFNVKLMPVKVVDTDWDFIFNSPFIGTDDTVARGIRYAVDNGARVLNMSIGRSGPPAPVVQSAITYAVSKGAFVAVAGGNEFGFGAPPQRLAEFAPQINGMVAVGAVGPDRRRASYSSVGSFIELMAPGGEFNSNRSEDGILQQTLDLTLVETFLASPSRYTAPRFDAFAYYYFEGTSMSTPHVAGFAALLMQQGVTDPAAIEAVMKQSATDLGAAGRDDEYGYGLINPRAALHGLGLAK